LINAALIVALVSYYTVMFITPGPNNAMLTISGVPIDGNLEKIPFYLHINCVRELHRKSADYVKKEVTADNTKTTDTKGTVSTTAPVEDTVSV
jgi:hypothetical protein